MVVLTWLSARLDRGPGSWRRSAAPRPVSPRYSAHGAPRKAREARKATGCAAWAPCRPIRYRAALPPARPGATTRRRPTSGRASRPAARPPDPVRAGIPLRQQRCGRLGTNIGMGSAVGGAPGRGALLRQRRRGRLGTNIGTEDTAVDALEHHQLHCMTMTGASLTESGQDASRHHERSCRQTNGSALREPVCRSARQTALAPLSGNALQCRAGRGQGVLNKRRGIPWRARSRPGRAIIPSPALQRE